MPHFRRACYRDIPAIQTFIDENYQANHILSKSKALFVHEYFSLDNTLDETKPINMFVLEESAEIVAILGFYEDGKEYFLSLWSAKAGSVYGILLLKKVEEALQDKPIRIIGLSKQAEQLYSKLGYKVESLLYQFTARRTFQQAKTGKKIHAEQLADLGLNEFEQERSRYEKRLIHNPFETYCLYYFSAGIIYVYKKYQTKANDFLLICDIIGDLAHFSEQHLQEIMAEENFPYASIYANQVLTGLKIVADEKMLFPIYTAPYLEENITLKYAYQNKRPVIFQLRSDQGRPNKLSEPFALVNNFMYHYIRDDSEKQTVNNYVSKALFEQQIDYLVTHYHPIKMVEIETGNFDERLEYFMVSFDDGYQEHYQIAAKYLEQQNVEGQFFIPAREAADLLEVNKIHQILNYYEPEEITQVIRNIEPAFADKYAAYSQVVSLDKPEIIFIKRYLQKEAKAASIIAELFKKIPPVNYADYYLNETEQTYLSNKHIVGNHTCKHDHLTDLSPVEIETDIKHYEQKLGNLMHGKIIAYPFGSQNKMVRDCYEQAGYIFGWGTKSSYSIVPASGSLNLNRYDCNELNAYIKERVKKHV